jgi:hypothetical protein
MSGGRYVRKRDIDVPVAVLQKKRSSLKNPEPCDIRQDNHHDQQHDHDLVKAALTDKKVMGCAGGAIRLKAELALGFCLVIRVLFTVRHSSSGRLLYFK